jgi:hypothetical protein
LKDDIQNFVMDRIREALPEGYRLEKVSGSRGKGMVW